MATPSHQRAMVVHCPKCSHRLRVSPEHVGKKGMCPRCEFAFIIIDEEQGLPITKTGLPPRSHKRKRNEIFVWATTGFAFLGCVILLIGVTTSKPEKSLSRKVNQQLGHAAPAFSPKELPLKVTSRAAFDPNDFERTQEWADVIIAPLKALYEQELDSMRAQLEPDRYLKITNELLYQENLQKALAQAKEEIQKHAGKKVRWILPIDWVSAEGNVFFRTEVGPMCVTFPGGGTDVVLPVEQAKYLANWHMVLASIDRIEILGEPDGKSDQSRLTREPVLNCHIKDINISVATHE